MYGWAIACCLATPDEFPQYLKDETAKWSKAVSDAGIKLEQ